MSTETQRAAVDVVPSNRGLAGMWRNVVILLVVTGTVWSAVVILISFTKDDTIVDLGYKHFPTLLGLPAATAAALVIVFVTRAIAGQMSVQFFGLKFQGAAGESIIWILCFLAMVYGIQVTWKLQYVPTEPLIHRSESSVHPGGNPPVAFAHEPVPVVSPAAGAR